MVSENNNSQVGHESVSKKAVCALIFALLSPVSLILLFLIFSGDFIGPEFLLPLILDIVAIILGASAIRDIRQSADLLAGSRLATTGIVLAIILLIVLFCFIVP